MKTTTSTTLPLPTSTLASHAVDSDATRPIRLDALTSLRFFAAILVLSSHAVPVFFANTFDKLETIPLAQGVSFFFVLSGFILTYVHPRIDNFESGIKFLRARIARVFPAHIVTAALSLGVASFSLSHLNKTTWSILLSNVFMLQSWIPQARYYYSLNAPAWSISTEFFFYLAFPFLIQNTPEKHRRNLLIGLVSLLACLGTAGALHLPELPLAENMSMRALIYIQPLARLFEFCLGISCAVIFQNLLKKDVQKKLDSMTASLLEIGVIASIAAYVLNIFAATRCLQTESFALALSEWLIYDGNCFAFAALIVLCALQKGLVSKFLSGKVLLWLGEISYSLYLLHFVILNYYTKYASVHSASISQYPPAILMLAYLFVTVVLAHLMHKFVETPMRKWIMSLR